MCSACELTTFYRMVERLSTRAAEPRRLDRVYGAIADPTRRAMLGILARGDVNVGMLAQRFPISFNGVSKHVKVLEQAGLVRRSVRGREHWLALRPAPLRDASRWLEHYREFWDNRLDALEELSAAAEGRRQSPNAGMAAQGQGKHEQQRVGRDPGRAAAHPRAAGPGVCRLAGSGESGAVDAARRCDGFNSRSGSEGREASSGS